MSASSLLVFQAVIKSLTCMNIPFKATKMIEDSMHCVRKEKEAGFVYYIIVSYTACLFFFFFCDIEAA